MNILIFGATSDIAQELANQYAKQNNNITLLGIGTEMLGPFKTDLEIRHNVEINLIEFDILQNK